MSLIIDEHRQYLEDANRLAAFERAIGATVRPGDVVLDLGAGTGILGLFACRAGAARVYAVDEGPIIAVARELAAANGYGERIAHIRGLSTWIDLPEPVDAIVTDQIGGFGFEAGLFEYLVDARRRWLKPGGRVVPGRLSVWAAPCEFGGGRQCVDFWSRPVAGFDMSPVHAMAGCTGYPAALAAEHLLSAGGPVQALDLSTADGRVIEGDVDCCLDRPGRIDGIAGWFAAELAPGVTMTNAPASPVRIARRPVFLPVAPVHAPAGARVRMTIRVLPDTHTVDWQVSVVGPSGEPLGRCRRSTFGGMLVSREDLARSAPEARPRLGRAGQARRLILEWCDGSRTTREIEAEVLLRFPDIVRGPSEAAAFVAEVLTVYAE